MIISKENFIWALTIIPTVTNILTSPVSAVINNLSSVSTNNSQPSSLNKVHIIENKITQLINSSNFAMIDKYAQEKTPLRRSLTESRKIYKIQRECLKQVISDLYSLDDIIRPQIFESEICGEMVKTNDETDKLLDLQLVKVSENGCLKFCEDTQRQLNENRKILAFKDGHLDFEQQTLDQNQPIINDAEVVQQTIDEKKRRVSKTLEEIQRLEEECNSVLNNEAKNIANSIQKKVHFDQRCRPNFNQDIHYPEFPSRRDIAYDGVSKHLGNLINTCREMLIEHVELANTEIWQKKSTDRSAVDF